LIEKQVSDTVAIQNVYMHQCFISRNKGFHCSCFF